MKKQILFCGLMLSVLAMHAGPKPSWADRMGQSDQANITQDTSDQEVRKLLTSRDLSQKQKATIGSKLFVLNRMDLWASAIGVAGARTETEDGHTPIEYALRAYHFDKEKSMNALDSLADCAAEPSELMNTKSSRGESGFGVVRAMVNRDCNSAEKKELRRPVGLVEGWLGWKKDVSPQCANTGALLDFLEKKKLIESKSEVLR